MLAFQTIRLHDAGSQVDGRNRHIPKISFRLLDRVMILSPTVSVVVSQLVKLLEPFNIQLIALEMALRCDVTLAKAQKPGGQDGHSGQA